MVGGPRGLRRAPGGTAGPRTERREGAYARVVDHEHAAATAPLVELSILEREPRPGLLDRALAALRAERLVGVVVRDDLEQGSGGLSAALAVDDRGLLLVATSDGVESGLALETVAARLSRSLDAAVLLAPAGEPDGEQGPASEPVSVGPPGFDPAAAIAEREAALAAQPSRVVALLAANAEAVAQRLPELSHAAGGRAVLVPVDERCLVAVDAPAFPQWWRAARPVIALVAREDRVDLLVWLREPLGRRRRLVERLVGADADWAISWTDRPIGVQQEESSIAALALQESMRGTEPLEIPDRLALELGWDAPRRAALAALWAEPATRVGVDRIIDAIGGPEVMARLALGDDAELEPGATAYAPTTVRSMAADAMVAASRPHGRTAWSRWELWWWNRPALSTIVGIAILAIVGVLAVGATLGEEWTLWRVAVCAVGVLNGGGLLGAAALARRERRQRER